MIGDERRNEGTARRLLVAGRSRRGLSASLPTASRALPAGSRSTSSSRRRASCSTAALGRWSAELHGRPFSTGGAERPGTSTHGAPTSRHRTSFPYQNVRVCLNRDLAGRGDNLRLRLASSEDHHDDSGSHHRLAETGECSVGITDTAVAEEGDAAKGIGVARCSRLRGDNHHTTYYRQHESVHPEALT